MTEKQFAIGNDAECPVIEGKFKLNREEVVDLLNKQDEHLNILREELELAYNQNTKLEKENEQLKKELFESEKDYIMETYSDNPIRRDEKIQSLKEEFKARFGDVE
jgi:hypothetical protein